MERASALGGWLLRTLGPLTGTQKTVIRNLRIAFPDMDEAERNALALAQWDQTGRTFAELAVMDQLTPEGGRVEVVGLERLHTLRDSGKPAVLISGHLANFEVMAAVIMAAGRAVPGHLSGRQQPLCRRPDPQEPRTVRHPPVRAQGRWDARSDGGDEAGAIPSPCWSIRNTIRGRRCSSSASR